jgi:hypothetical protein
MTHATAGVWSHFTKDGGALDAVQIYPNEVKRAPDLSRDRKHFLEVCRWRLYGSERIPSR